MTSGPTDRRGRGPGRRAADTSDRLISQVREANEALVLATLRAEASEATFRSLFDTMPQLGWLARPDGHIYFYNRGWYAYTGTTLAQMEGWGWRSVHDPAVLPDLEAHWRTCVETGTPFEVACPLRGDDGRYRWFLTRANPERDEAGKVVRWVGINTDIDDQRRNEQQLAIALERERLARSEADLAVRRKDEFLAMLAHELRNPLAALSAAQHLLAQTATTDPQLLRQNAISERQVRHLTRLVDDLLDVARFESGSIELRRERVDLVAVVADALEDTRELMVTRHQEVSFVPDPVPWWVSGDPTRLLQVFNNLLVNAAKYTPDGGRIAIRCVTEARAEGPWARVEIEDTGQGIAPEMLDEVFHLFAQVDHSLDRTGGGLGLGLTLARRLVGLHGGEVHAHSDGLGRGSTFTVELPLIGAPAVSVAARRPRRDASINPRLVVIEDNDDAREMLQAILQQWGHVVEVAADGEAGAKLILASLPDMALIDVGLPGLDGFEVAQAVRASPLAARTLLVALTGYGDATTRGRAIAAGFDHHLVKPVTPEQLALVLSKRSF
ncbi:MAG: ATP-binding protein [Proteobacteria bacterium]|nr:ATP-binding protein [Pseudomonadota bacterium]